MTQSLFKKPTNCKCDGGFRVNGHRWRVIERRDLPQSSHLKCLDCGWKWWSVCKYAIDLPDHVESSYSGMTDAMVIDKINSGALTVLVNEARVFSWGQNKWRELTVIERESNGSKYRFVEICYRGKKKKVALHRLVWMFANRSVVPGGYDVDHIEADKRDTIDNLRLLDSSANRRRGKPQKHQTERLPF